MGKFHYAFNEFSYLVVSTIHLCSSIFKVYKERDQLFIPDYYIACLVLPPPSSFTLLLLTYFFMNVAYILQMFWSICLIVFLSFRCLIEVAALPSKHRPHQRCLHGSNVLLVLQGAGADSEGNRIKVEVAASTEEITIPKGWPNRTHTRHLIVREVMAALAATEEEGVVAIIRPAPTISAG